MNKRQLINKAKLLVPVLRIGKSGLNDSVLKEIKRQLKAKKLIKLKFLKSCLDKFDKKQLAREIASKTNSELVQQVGFVIVLYRE